MSINPLFQAFKSGLKPDKKMDISQWADNFRILPSESSSEPGRYRTDRMPYLQEIYEELSPQSKTQEVCVTKGTQLGFTELGNNMLFCYADLYPCPMLQVLHTETAVRTHAKDKIWSSIRKSPRLKEKFRDIKSKDGSSTTKLVFTGGSIDIGWSNTTATFASMSRRIVIMDDIDRWPDDVGGEGDPIELAKKRTDAFPNRKIYINSTPTTVLRSKIHKSFEQSSQGHYEMKCPHCQKGVYFEKEHFKFDKNEEYELIGDVTFCCEHCGSLIKESHKNEMMKTENGAKWVHKYPDREVRGYRLPSFYSPFLRWNEIFKEFLEAYKLMKKTHYTKKMIVWENTRNARAWEEDQGEQLEGNFLLNRREDYTLIPDDVIVLTCGVDTQDDRLEGEIKAWGYGEESWGIKTFRIEGKPSQDQVWRDLENIINATYKREDGTILRIACTCIDSGGHFTNEVYKFAKKWDHRRVYAVKGASIAGKPIISRPTTSNKLKVKLFTIGVDTAKELIYSRLKFDTFGAGYMHFCKTQHDEEYFAQLTAEKLVTTYKHGRPQRVWKATRARNEAIDYTVYNLAALNILNPNFEKIRDGLERMQEPKQQKTEKKTITKKQGGFINAWKR